jgi:acyl-CoA synthetase (AMP-forming)/AMP-acid ligase II
VSTPVGVLSGRELASAAAELATKLEAGEPALVWATSSLETIVGVIGALAAGAPVVPVDPHSGVRELEHVVTDARPRRGAGQGMGEFDFVTLADHELTSASP